MAMEHIFASSISRSVRTNSSKSRTSAMIAEAVTDTVAAKASNDKVEYYVFRGLEDISNGIKDADFELGNILTGEKPVIDNIVTTDKGNTKVFASKCFSVSDPRDITRAREKLATIKIGDNFAKYVGVRVNNAADKVCIDIVIVLPEEYVTSIGGSDYKKRPTVIDKTVKKILDDVLKG